MHIDKETSTLLYDALSTYKKHKDEEGTLTLPELARIEGLQTIIYMEGKRPERCICGQDVVENGMCADCAEDREQLYREEQEHIEDGSLSMDMCACGGIHYPEEHDLSKIE